MKLSIVFILAFLLALQEGTAQCDSVVIGTADTLSMDLTMTPFPTSVGRGSKVQYLFTASELACLGPTIYAYDLIVADSGNWQVAYNVRSGMMHTVDNSLNPLSYDLSATDSAYLDLFHVGVHGYDTVSMQPIFGGMHPGRLLIELDSPFNWNGVENVILEISYNRTPIFGTSPRVVLDTGLSFQATNYGYHPGATSGWHYTTSIPATIGTAPGSQIGTNNTRPVVTFYGSPLVTNIEEEDFSDVGLWPNPVSQVLHFRSDESVELELFDAAGTVALRDKMQGNELHELNVSNFEGGVYILRITNETGAHVRTERIIIQR